MYASTTAFATMIDDAQITYEVKVGIDLPGGIYPDVTLAVESISIDRSYTTDLPDGKRLQEGIPQATATITLKGAVDDTDPSKTVAWLFGPYQTSSPLFRSSVLQRAVTIDVGGYPAGAAGTPELFRKFTGVISRKPVVRDGTVTLTCVDNRGTWRDAPTPLLVNSSGASNTGLTSEYALDALSRQASGYTSLTWPKPIFGCIAAAGMRTSTFPEVGAVLADYTPSFGPGAFGSALSGGSLVPDPHGGPPDNGPIMAQFTAAEYKLAAPYGLGASNPYLFASCWVTGDFSTVFPSIGFGRGPWGDSSTWSPNWIKLAVKSTGLEVSSNQFATQTWSTTVAAGAHYVAVWMKTNSTTVDITVWLDGTSQTWTAVAVTSGTIAFLRNYVAVGWSGSTPASTIEALQVSANVGGFPFYDTSLLTNTFTPNAHIDPSLNPLSVVPPMSGDTWSVVQQIAQAELGVAGFDESGGFFFKNRNTLRTSSAVRQLTSTNALVDMTVEESVDGVANRVQVESTPYRFGGKSTIWQLNEPTKIGRGQSKTWTVSTDNPITSFDGSFTVLPNGSTSTSSSFYRLSTDRAGVAEVSGALIVVVAQTTGTTLTITATNVIGRDVWLVSPANYSDLTVGTPVFRLAGAVASPSDAIVSDVQYPPVNPDGSGGAASSLWHEVLCEIKGNPWIQSSATGALLAQAILDDMPAPRPNLVDVAIVPDVRLQLGDRVQIVDSDVHGVNEYAVIFGQSLRVRRGELSMTVDARTVVAPGACILGVTGRSELGSTTYL